MHILLKILHFAFKTQKYDILKKEIFFKMCHFKEIEIFWIFLKLKNVGFISYLKNSNYCSIIFQKLSKNPYKTEKSLKKIDLSTALPAA